MTKRPSIISAFSAVADAPARDPAAPAGAETGSSRPVRVPAGIIGATARTLSDIRQERDELVERLANIGGLREVDPALLDPSPFPDRLDDDDDGAFAALKQLIADEGQKVAIQVRAHPASPGRYQIIYGHRRWRAAKELGRPVRVEVVAATDEQVAVAQGIENSARQDLTWIEKALFAWRLEQSGIKAKGIRAALSVDDAELTKYRTVCRALPADVIEGIGRAPHVGRPRWVDLATAVAASSAALPAIRKTLADAKVSAAASDDRFRLVLNRLRKPKELRCDALALKRPDGKPMGRLATSRRDVRIIVDREHAEAFSGFLRAEMPDLVAKFFASQDADKPMTTVIPKALAGVEAIPNKRKD